MSSWEVFVREGRQFAERAKIELSRSGERTAVSAALDALFAFEVDARIVGLPELGDLASLVRKRLARAETRVDEESVEAVRDAVDALTGAVIELAQNDVSGAKFDVNKLERLGRDLGARKSAPPPPLPADPSEDRWVPSVEEDMIDPFLDECQERLDGLAEKLVELERSPGEGELVRAIFRDLHTLKGSSAFVGLKKMTRVAHAAEDLVGNVRDGKAQADRSLIDRLLAALDVLAAIVKRATTRSAIDVDIGPILAMLAGEARAVRAFASQSFTKPPAAAAVEAVAESRAPERRETLRIDFEKLDLLMNLLGELVLAKGRLGSSMGGLRSVSRELDHQRRNAGSARSTSRARSGAVRSEDLSTELGRIQRAFDQLSGELDSASQRLDFVSGELRDQVMKLRMVPIGRAWSKYRRTVREMANSLGKNVRLELYGDETELDKVLIDQLDDPFLHLIRNAIDHGVESPAVRASAGKPEEGVLKLSAAHRGNQIVIRVEDDGGGIDVTRVRQKAIENGILDASSAEALDDDQIFDLIFRPGFSTARTVSDISGRGVGMDVVRSTISALKGSVTVHSELGVGTTFEVRLPLTLAIIHVLLVRAAGETYAIPLDLVRRTVSAKLEHVRFSCNREVLYDAGRDVPLVRLRDVLGLPPSAAETGPELAIALVDIGDELFGIACDGFLGRQEIVIKSLGALLARVPGAAGATLLGERCVIILDVPALLGMALRSPVVARAEVARVAARPGAPRILVAEDSDVVRESIRRTLDAAGYDVVVAEDGRVALDLATAQQFDLVSTDVVMPKMDGYELTRRLREMESYREIPIVMVTSKDERIDRIRGFDAGVDAYLTKPADASELLRVIVSHLGAKKR